MGLVRTSWTGQLARAAGASLIAPLALLLAAGIVASGGGLGAFGSLREIASGPSLPDIGLATQPGSGLRQAEIISARGAPPAAGVEVRQTAQAPEVASATPPAPRRATARRGPPAAPPAAPQPQPPTQPFKLGEPPRIPGAGVTAPPAPPSTPALAIPAPVEDLLETTRGLGDTLGAPLQPLTNLILNLLRRPPPGQ